MTTHPFVVADRWAVEKSHCVAYWRSVRGARQPYAAPVGGYAMALSQTLLTIVCPQCGSRMKKWIDSFAISDLQIVCPGCVSTISASAAEVRACIARDRLGLLTTEVSASLLAGPGHGS